ncbi:MAG: hypothetical protein O9306_07965 [Beijerinckiaceae bacterium]|jgi:hypothetical protein|nr:hypothetical protein [Beijerinckiaceae bacterium]
MIDFSFRSVMTKTLRLAVVVSIGAVAYHAWSHAEQASKTNASFEELDRAIKCASRLGTDVLERLSKAEPHGNFDIAPFGCSSKAQFITNMREIEEVRRGEGLGTTHRQKMFDPLLLFAKAIGAFLIVLSIGLAVWFVVKIGKWVLKG